MKYQQDSNILRDLLGMKGKPVGIRFAASEEEYADIPMFTEPTHTCYLVREASVNGYLGGITAEALDCTNERVSYDLPMSEEQFADALAMQTEKYAAGEEEVARKMLEERPKYGGEKLKALLVGPLDAIPFEPDLVIVIGKPYRVQRLLHAYSVSTGGQMHVVLGTNATLCAYGVAQAMKTGTAQVFLSCNGALLKGGFTDTEIGMAIPMGQLNMFIEGLIDTDALSVAED